MSSASIDVSGPVGIGGWLLLPFLGLLVSLGITGLSLYSDVLPALGSDIWPVLTTPGSAVYHASWGPYLIAALVINVVVILAALTLLFLGFGKRKHFPLGMIGFYVLCAIAMSLDVWAAEGFLAEAMPAEAAEMKPEAWRDFVRTITTGLLWSAYFLVSKRVKNTFVR